MRRRIMVGGAIAVLATACALALRPNGGSNPAQFARDFRASVAAESDRTRALQNDAKGALTDNGGSVLTVYRAMLGSAERSAESYGTLRAPRPQQPELKRVVELCKAQVASLERIINAAETGGTQRLTDALRTLAETMADREGAVQAVLREIDPQRTATGRDDR